MHDKLLTMRIEAARVAIAELCAQGNIAFPVLVSDKHIADAQALATAMAAVVDILRASKGLCSVDPERKGLRSGGPSERAVKALFETPKLNDAIPLAREALVRLEEALRSAEATDGEVSAVEGLAEVAASIVDRAHLRMGKWSPRRRGPGARSNSGPCERALRKVLGYTYP